MFCNKCGNQLAGTKFCNKCGAEATPVKSSPTPEGSGSNIQKTIILLRERLLAIGGKLSNKMRSINIKLPDSFRGLTINPVFTQKKTLTIAAAVVLVIISTTLAINFFGRVQVQARTAEVNALVDDFQFDFRQVMDTRVLPQGQRLDAAPLRHYFEGINYFLFFDSLANMFNDIYAQDEQRVREAQARQGQPATGSGANIARGAGTAIAGTGNALRFIPKWGQIIGAAGTIIGGVLNVGADIFDYQDTTQTSPTTIPDFWHQAPHIIFDTADITLSNRNTIATIPVGIVVAVGPHPAYAEFMMHLERQSNNTWLITSIGAIDEF